MSAAAFVIPTRGRAALVGDLLDTIRRQTVPCEVLVMDDGASADLAERLQRDFPSARYYCLGTGKGPAFQRNRGIELARSEIVFPVDDDTVLPSPHTVGQTLREFDDPRIGAVAVPYVNVRDETRVRERPPDDRSVWVVHAFTGASHAVRRSAFLDAGGYREHYFYMGEEGDLCLRLLDRGLVVRCGAADPIHHLESPHRNSALADYCGRRNDIFFAWENVPATVLPMHLAGTTFKGLVSAIRAPHRLSAVRGIGAGYLQMRSHSRSPVSPATYRLQRELKKRGPLRLADIAGRLPPLHATALR